MTARKQPGPKVQHNEGLELNKAKNSANESDDSKDKTLGDPNTPDSGHATPDHVSNLPDGEEIAARQADDDSASTNTFTRTYLLAGPYETENFDHGPNKQALIQEAINNGLRVTGKAAARKEGSGWGRPGEGDGSYAQGDPLGDGDETNDINSIDIDAVVRLVNAEEVDYSSNPNRKMINSELTYEADVIPAHRVGSNQWGEGELAPGETVAPSDAGSTGAEV